MKFIEKLIPHVCIVLALVVLTLFILSRFNPGVSVSSFYSAAMYLFCITALVTSGILIARNTKE